MVKSYTICACFQFNLISFLGQGQGSSALTQVKSEQDHNTDLNADERIAFRKALADRLKREVVQSQEL
eukprot:m.311000 g.311000  ORF g.311000 m.311000 type:complete len:68 (+) comp16481_c0_seq13:470-673(+)